MSLEGARLKDGYDPAGTGENFQSQLQGLLELHRLELLKFLLSGCEERFQRV